MAEQFLHDSKIGPVIEHVGRAGVPEHVWRQLVAEADAIAVLLDHRPCRLPRQPGAAQVQEHCFGVAAACPTLGLQVRAARRAEPFRHRRAPRTARTERSAPSIPCRTA